MFLVNCFERFTMLCRCFLLSKTPQSFIIRLFVFFLHFHKNVCTQISCAEGESASAPLPARLYMWQFYSFDCSQSLSTLLLFFLHRLFCFFAFSPLHRLLFSQSTSIQDAFFVAWLFQSSFIPSTPVIYFAALFVCCCCCGIMWLVVCFLFLLFRYPCQRLWYCGCWAGCFCDDPCTIRFFLYMNFQIVLCVFCTYHLHFDFSSSLFGFLLPHPPSTFGGTVFFCPHIMLSVYMSRIFCTLLQLMTYRCSFALCVECMPILTDPTL